MDYRQLAAISHKNLDGAVALAQRMIRIRSLSGEEREMADLVREAMLALSYDEVTVDEVGNVIGVIRGSGGGRSVMFNSHLDTVDCGELSRWKHQPFAGDVEDGMLWGLGASDTKGAFACQIVAAAALKQEGLLPPGDIYVVGVVHEESSGFGSIYLAPRLVTDVVILGEASDNQLKIGHRGRLEFDLHLRGKSTHASVPARGVNPHFTAAKILLALQALPLAADPFFGVSSVAPTLYTTDNKSGNVTPGEVVLSLDWRNIPAESADDVQQQLQTLVDSCLEPGISAEIRLKMRDVVCYTGYKGRGMAGEPSYATPPDDSDVLRAQAVLEKALARPVHINVCQFATDGGHFRVHGCKVLIFAPVEEKYCHTADDSVAIEKMREAILGNMALALGLSQA
jgi:succinyl-diaminopimelate desuccinylase